MRWKVGLHLVCACVVVVCAVPRNRTVHTGRYLSGSLGCNDSDRTPSSPEITSSHLDIKEYSYSDIFRTLPPTNSSEKRKKKHRKKKRSNPKVGFWTKAGTAVASLINGYNAIKRNFGNGNLARRSTDYDYDSDDLSESSEQKPKKRSKQLKQMKQVEATTMSPVEEAYRRALTFTPKYKWDSDTTETPTFEEEESNSGSGSTDGTDKLDKGKGEMAAPGKGKKELSNLKRKDKIGRAKMKEKKVLTSKKKGKSKEFVPRRRGRLKQATPWRSASYIKPILSTTGKVIRGLDTLAYYASYFSYTILPMSMAAIQAFRNILPAPETIAKIEGAAPLEAL